MFVWYSLAGNQSVNLDTAKNGLVKELYPRLGFELASQAEATGETVWEFDLSKREMVQNSLVAVES